MARPKASTADADGKLPAFPEAAWRGAFADYRTAMAGTTEAPDVFHFTALWVDAAVRLRRRVWFRYARRLYPNVYVVTVGASGDTKKTTAMRQGRELPAEATYVKVMRGIGSPEALGDWMGNSANGATPLAQLLLLEELAKLLALGQWHGSQLFQFLTETFDTPDEFSIAFRKNPVHVVEPTPSLQAGTTTQWFWKYMRDEDIEGGFGNRLFYATGVPNALIPLPGEADTTAFARVRNSLHRLEQVHAGPMHLTPEATALWSEFYIAFRKTKKEPLVAALTKRIPDYALKLALIYAAFEGTAPAITDEQLAAAVQVGGFGLECAEWLVTQRRSVTVQGRCEELILHVLDRVDLPAWKIHQRISGRFSAEEVSRALKALQFTGAVIEVRTTARGVVVHGRRGRSRKA
jgi:hypothetical protein